MNEQPNTAGATIDLEAAGSLLLKNLRGKRVCYIDVPTYFNFGDMLIFIGAMDLFQKYNIELVGCFSAPQIINNPDLIRRVNAEVIVCQGGGNFGDLYPLHQTARKKVISHYRNTPIVIFPQSAHYLEQKNLQRDLEIFGVHRQVSAFARDFKTHKLFNECNFNTNYSVDTAHFINPKRFPTFEYKKADTLLFYRRDKESNEIKNKNSIDWDEFFGPADVFLKRAINQSSMKLTWSPYVSSILMKIWTYYCLYKLNIITKKLKKYKQIKTDRLHVWILSNLLNIDVKNSDNSYGKIEKYKQLLVSDYIKKLER